MKKYGEGGRIEIEGHTFLLSTFDGGKWAA
jgi:hypothetical protein